MRDSNSAKYLNLVNSSEYADAVKSYSNQYKNGAGRQKPGSAGFALWLLYDLFLKNTGAPPTAAQARTFVEEHGLNTISVVNAFGKWSVYHGFRVLRTGEYVVGSKF